MTILQMLDSELIRHWVFWQVKKNEARARPIPPFQPISPGELALPIAKALTRRPSSN